jgi:hypothetical protein
MKALLKEDEETETVLREVKKTEMELEVIAVITKG